MADLQSVPSEETPGDTGNSEAVTTKTTTATGRDVDLAAVIAAWPDLSSVVRAGILAMVNASRPIGDPRC